MGLVAQQGSDDGDALTMVVVLIVVVLVLAQMVWLGAGFAYRERHLFAEALVVGGMAAVLFGTTRFATSGRSRPDEELLDRLFGTVGWVWLIGMVVALTAWSGDWPLCGGPLFSRPRTLPGLLARYAAYSVLGYAVAGMLGLSVVLLITSQLAYSFIEAQRAAKRADRQRGMDEIWDAEP